MLENLTDVRSKSYVTYKNYYLSTNIKCNDIILSVFKYIETKKTTIFRYISDLEVKDSNIKEVISIGRKNR